MCLPPPILTWLLENKQSDTKTFLAPRMMIPDTPYCSFLSDILSVMEDAFVKLDFDI